MTRLTLAAACRRFDRRPGGRGGGGRLRRVASRSQLVRADQGNRRLRGPRRLPRPGPARPARLLLTARDLRRLREWAGSAPERDAERKEATSAIAAKRAEELRALEEARTAEHDALDEREAAPPAPRGRPAGADPRRAPARAASPASATGSPNRAGWSPVFVVVLLVAGGVVYAGDAAAPTAPTARASTARPRRRRCSRAKSKSPCSTAPRSPGLAATYGDKVEHKGFKLGAVTNSSTSFAESVVMFERGHAPEAQTVAKRARDLRACG